MSCFCHAAVTSQASVVEMASTCSTLRFEPTACSLGIAALGDWKPIVAFEPSQSNWEAFVWERDYFASILRSSAECISRLEDDFTELLRQTRATCFFVQRYI